jgi:hypothetical protein
MKKTTSKGVFENNLLFQEKNKTSTNSILQILETNKIESGILKKDSVSQETVNIKSMGSSNKKSEAFELSKIEFR